MLFNIKKSENTNKIKYNIKNNTCPELGLNQRPSAFQADALPLSYPNYNITITQQNKIMFKKKTKNN